MIVDFETGRSSGSGILPSHPLCRQTVVCRIVLSSVIGTWRGLYSYGDSAGFAPDFPFNPGLIPGTKFVANVQQYLSSSKLILQQIVQKNTPT
jgi:hypothetical protein